MTTDDADIVLNLFTTADGGCSVCCEGLMRKFINTWPEYKKMAEEIYRRIFEEELELND